jgi:N4-(beta-N-acetylglucosaminyl)-L-asparaginase
LLCSSPVPVLLVAKTQPSYWVDTDPPPASGCGPFRPAGARGATGAVGAPPPVTSSMHDTLSIAAIDAHGSIAAATTTNGLAFKLPGRVGDAAIPGSGNYARSGVGACGSTGDGDVMMRFLPCYQAVESLRLGWTPQQAAEDAIARIVAVVPSFTGAVFVLAADGRHAGAGHNWIFQYTVRREGDAAATVYTVGPLDARRAVALHGRAPAAHLLAAAAVGALLASFVLRGAAMSASAAAVALQPAAAAPPAAAVKAV